MIKTISLLSAIFFVVIACNAQDKQFASYQEYGEKFEVNKPIEVTELNRVMNTKDSLSISFVGAIEEFCQAKGCWMTIKTGDGSAMRVTFKDYGFFVPTEGIEGKKTIINGVCVLQETSIEELRHYARDAGKTDKEVAMITEAKKEYSFVASGVIIED